MPLSPLEVMADAIMAFEGWKPKNRSYRNRNPGNLEESKYQVAKDEKGYCVFSSLTVGYQALLFDLNAKATGNTHHKLSPDSTLQQLFDIYAPRADHNDPGAYCLFVCQWLRSALDRDVQPYTRLRDIFPPAAPPAQSEVNS